jgi:RIO kinase 1
VAGVIHGDLSEFNRLAGADGPVIIDLPQAVDAAGNNHAFVMLERDVGNLRNFFGRFAPEIAATNYAGEIWAHFQAGVLTPETRLTGSYEREFRAADVEGVVREIGDAEREEAARQLRRALRD